MNILIDIRPLLDERYSGVAEYTLSLITALLEIDNHNNYILFYNSFRNLDERVPTFLTPRVKIIKTRFPNKIFNYLFLTLLRRPYFDRLVGEPVDIIFLPHLNFAAWSKNSKAVITIHDLSFIHYPQFFSLRKNIWHRFLGIRRLLRQANHIITLSANTKQDIITYAHLLKEKITVVYSGVSDSFRKITDNDQTLTVVKEKYKLPDRFILFLGTVEPRKNLLTLIKAFEIIKQQAGCEDIALVIAGGRGWKARPIYTQARMSQYTSDIIFLDYVPAAEKVYLYNLATFFVYPSFYEGFGFPPLEAMACGVPTIVSAVSSLPEVVEDAAILIDPYNTNSLVTAMTTLLQDPNLYQQYSLAGQKQAQKFSWRTTAQHYLTMFEKINRNV